MGSSLPLSALFGMAGGAVEPVLDLCTALWWALSCSAQAGSAGGSRCLSIFFGLGGSELIFCYQWLMGFIAIY